MVYKIKKNDFTLTFTVEKKGIVLSVVYKNAKEYYSLSSNGKVFKLINNEWSLLNTKTLHHERTPENSLERGAFDLIKIILLFPVGLCCLTLEFDELFFLQALAYDLLNPNQSLKWLPLGNEYSFVNDKLETFYEGDVYTYEMPRALGVPMSDFINTPIKKISKTRNLRIPIKNQYFFKPQKIDLPPLVIK